MTYRSSVWADERNVLGVISCVAASWVNVARAATNGAIPATDAEVLGLRHDSGDVVGGEDLPTISKGSLRRYGWTGTLDDQWATIVTGTQSGGMWFAVLGWYRALPPRLKNPGQADVFHCICVGPNAPGSVQVVDSLQTPVVQSRTMTTAELNGFCSTGAFQSLGIAEYSHAVKHGHIAVHGLVFVYTKVGLNWTRQARPAWFSADTTLAKSYSVMGKTRQMVEVTTGAYHGRWFDVGASFVRYTEEV